MVMVCGWLLLLVVRIGIKGEVLHKVGNSEGWSPNQNYTHWSTSHHFYLGDWLYFVFDKRYYNVLEVNKRSYEDCNDKDFIKNITRGGRDVFQLSELHPYFFIGGGGYCFQGMKLAVYVSAVDSAPAPSPAASNKSGGGASFLSNNPTFCCSVLNALLLFVAIFLLRG
ncbi:lamin-like protein [Cucumis melo var. makuwa]|uniref:Lamin-like protein n=1 Tax=Cucumis melo var. makuwa TaxID=1194695 RepID=A0A5A7UEY9_CUCMM|nr:lamin-like protein [Cucumis melo var. makuwa]TYK25601.1 lamin-like protein [Cucumis melo var. makuwa]